MSWRQIYTLSLHDALPISTKTASAEEPYSRLAGLEGDASASTFHAPMNRPRSAHGRMERRRGCIALQSRDRKSTRLNSSHVSISYAVFCLKKKKKLP